jgi:hypothetical protein
LEAIRHATTGNGTLARIPRRVTIQNQHKREFVAWCGASGALFFAICNHEPLLSSLAHAIDRYVKLMTPQMRRAQAA